MLPEKAAALGLANEVRRVAGWHRAMEALQERIPLGVLELDITRLAHMLRRGTLRRRTPGREHWSHSSGFVVNSTSFVKSKIRPFPKMLVTAWGCLGVALYKIALIGVVQ